MYSEIQNRKKKVSEQSKEVTEMEEKERREETAVHLAAELKKWYDSTRKTE